MSIRFTLGRYLNESVIIDSTTDYINATQLCVNVDKKLMDWVKLPTSKMQIMHFTDNMGGIAYNNKLSYEITAEEVSHMQLTRNIKSSIIGVYYHKYVINLIMQWLSPTYALTSSSIVNEYNKMRDASTTNAVRPIVTNDKNKIDEIHTIVVDLQATMKHMSSILEYKDNNSMSSDNSSVILID